jgi:hypothetical protein
MEMLSSTAAPGWLTRTSLAPRGIGIVGCLAVAVIHVIDQGGLPGSKGPEYIQRHRKLGRTTCPSQPRRRGRLTVSRRDSPGGISPRCTFLILDTPA